MSVPNGKDNLLPLRQPGRCCPLPRWESWYAVRRVQIYNPCRNQCYEQLNGLEGRENRDLKPIEVGHFIETGMGKVNVAHVGWHQSYY